jgi:DNA-directed RNA polymerase specialized sigma24 family protein
LPCSVAALGIHRIVEIEQPMNAPPNREVALFTAALGLPASERAAYLEEACADDPQMAELTKLRYFVGLTFEEAAEVLGVSVTTAKRYWAYARAFLYEEIRANNTK